MSLNSAAMHAPQRFRLAAHVRACRSDDQVILLDLSRSRYMGLGGAAADVLATVVFGWPAATGSPGAQGAASLEALTQRLVAQGLVTMDGPDQPSSLRDAQVTPASSSLNALDACLAPRGGVRRVGSCLGAALRARFRLRYQSLHAIARAAAMRRERLSRSQGAADDVPRSARLIETVAAYEKFRPLLFTASDQCLLDSLALLDYLSTEGFAPTWVIGVRTRPFNAHAWLQMGDVVLNDQHEHVRHYRPILAV